MAEPETVGAVEDPWQLAHPDLLPGRRVVAGWPAVVEAHLGGRPASTRAEYERALDEFTAWCAAHELEPLDDVTTLQVQRWVDELAGRHKPRTVQKKVAAVRGAYKWAFLEGVIARSPAERVRLPKVDQRMSTAVALTPQHLTRITEVAIAAGPFDHVLLMLYFATALRVSEPADADVSDYRDDSVPPVLWITGKGGNVVDVPLAPQTAAAVSAYLGERRSGPLLVNPRTGARLSRFAARRRIIALAKKAGLPRGVTTHTLRHAHVTRAGDLGVPLEAQQDSARHASPATTRLYDRARQRRALSSTSAVAGWLQLALEASDEVEKPEAAQNTPSVRLESNIDGGDSTEDVANDDAGAP